MNTIRAVRIKMQQLALQLEAVEIENPVPRRALRPTSVAYVSDPLRVDLQNFIRDLNVFIGKLPGG